jgi:dihydrofolate synthase/folylpolyglutamate synthase
LTYEQTLDYLFTKLPMYQRIGKQAFKKDLTNIIKLCDALGNPQNSFKSIHIAGTNGKGSTAHILSALYQNNGYNVGMYTSPHLVDFRERIKLNGEMCSKDFVVNFTQSITHLIDEIKPSFFEITVAMAFSFFAEKKVDVAIIETGLGGRLDSTNIIKPMCSIITSIGFDHMDMLGNTLQAIATEKAGIIKKDTPLIVGNLPSEALLTVKKMATDKSAPLHLALNGPFKTDLLGEYQQINIGIALACETVLQQELATQKERSLQAVERVASLSNFTGRWQVLNESPLVICDVGHNAEGIQLIANQLNKLQLNAYMILGFVTDKDLDKLIPLLPKATEFHFVKPEVIRGMDAKEVQLAFSKHQISGVAHANLKDAMDVAYQNMMEHDGKEDSVLFIGGSNFVVADLLHLKAQQKLPF